MSTGAVDLDADDVVAHYTDAAVASHPLSIEQWVAMAKATSAAGLRGATLISARLETPTHAVVEHSTPSGLHLEVHLALDPDDDFRIADIPGRRLAGGASQTALRAAAARAAHLEVEGGVALQDTLARALAGEVAESAIAMLRSSPIAIPLELMVGVRSRFAEDTLAEAYAQGTRQYVLLGAGLDSFAYRQPRNMAELRVFEVDQPSSQRWKRNRLAECEIAVPDSVSYVAVDFEVDDLDDLDDLDERLASTGRSRRWWPGWGSPTT